MPGIEHVTGHAQEFESASRCREVDHPDDLWKKDGNRLKAGKKTAFGPERDTGNEQGDVTKVEEIPRRVFPPVDGNQDREKERIRQLDPQRNPPCIGVLA